MFLDQDADGPSHDDAERTGGLAALLTSLQLTDSAFPSGFYTLSHSLEGFSQARAVTAAGLPALLTDLLRHGVGPGDATALALAHRAVRAGDLAAVVETDRRLHAGKLGREMRLAATRTGRQLLDLAAEIFGQPVIGRYLELVVGRQAPAPRRCPPEWSTRPPVCRSARPWPRTCSRSAPASPEPPCGCG